MTDAALRLVDDDGVLMGDDYLPPEPEREDTVESLRAELAEVKVQLQGAEREIKAWRARLAALETDHDRKARSDNLWEPIESLFNLWKEVCNHPRSDFTPDRFKLAKPIYKRKGHDACKLAILGAGFDPFVKEQKNGKPKRFDDWKLIFRDEDTFENFANRAPAEAIAEYIAAQKAQEELHQ